ncbi:hypothetical protein [Desulfurobacterium crinifex]
MVGAKERVRELKKELEMLEEIREAAKRRASRSNRYEEPPLQIQYKVNARAEQVLQANLVRLWDEEKKSGAEFLIAGKDNQRIVEEAKKLGLGEVVENYPVFKGNYKEAVELLRKKVKNFTAFSLAFLFSIPDVPHDGDLCLFSDYVKGLEHLAGQVREAFELVDEIYQTLAL